MYSLTHRSPICQARPELLHGQEKTRFIDKPTRQRQVNFRQIRIELHLCEAIASA
jgi:hypothetical protein